MDDHASPVAHHHHDEPEDHPGEDNNRLILGEFHIKSPLSRLSQPQRPKDPIRAIAEEKATRQADHQ
jgi:hypothetical protein